MTRKTERPTRRRLQRARQIGITPHSPLLSAAIAMAATATALLWAAPRLARALERALGESLHLAVTMPSGDPAGEPLVTALLRIGQHHAPWHGDSPWAAVLHPLVVLSLAALAAAVVASAVQRRSLRIPRAATARRGRRTGSRETGFVGTLGALQLLVLVALISDLAVRHAAEIAGLAGSAPLHSATVLAELTALVLVRVIGALLVFGVIDLGWQHYRVWRSLAMSRDEKRQEQRDVIGHPRMRTHRRRVHAELLASGPR